MTEITKPRGRNIWSSTAIASPSADGIWIIFCPLLALVVMEALWRFSGLSDDRIYVVVFAFIVTGHHMPGWLRAWGEPAVYEKHKARLWVSALAIPAMVIVPVAVGLAAVIGVVAAFFDLWHTSRQQHGFGRIYSGKAGDVAPGSARLELACVLVWYATAVAWSDAWMLGIATPLHASGLGAFDALSATGWHGVKIVMALGSALLVVLYVERAIRLWRTTKIVAMHKHALHAVMFAVVFFAFRAGSWYRAQMVQNLFHAMQYFFMVWVFGNLSIKRNATRPGAMYRALFARPRGIAIFVALVALYGGASIFLPSALLWVPGGESQRLSIASAIITASLFLHFYVDSFIWRVREGGVKKALSIDGAKAPIEPSAKSESWKGGLHALAYFGLPILLVALLGWKKSARSDEPKWVAHAAELFPGSASASQARGEMELGSGRRVAAREWLERAYALAPTLDGPAALLAGLDHDEGRREEELAHLQAAVDAAPDRGKLRLGLATALARTGASADAETEFRQAVRLSPERPEPHLGFAVLLRSEKRFGEAKNEVEAARQLAPDSPQVAIELAITYARAGDRPEALRRAAAFLETHPGHDDVAAVARAIGEGR